MAVKQLGYITYREAVGAIRRIPLEHPALPMRPKIPAVPRRGSVSHRLDGHLRAWWGAARAAGKLYCGSLIADFDYIGDPDWPDFVHVRALTQLAARTYDRKISASAMALWLKMEGVPSMKKSVCVRNKRGRVVYETCRTFYKIG